MDFIGNVKAMLASEYAGTKWLLVRNTGVADFHELVIVGGQSVEKRGESGIWHIGFKQAVSSLLLKGHKVITISEDEIHGAYCIEWDHAPGPEKNVGEQLVARVLSEKRGRFERQLDYTIEFGKSLFGPIGDDTNGAFRAISQLLINAAEGAANAGSPQAYTMTRAPGWSLLRSGETQVYVSMLDDDSDLEELASDGWGKYFKEASKCMQLPRIATLSPSLELWSKSSEQVRIFVGHPHISLRYLVYCHTPGHGWTASRTNTAYDYALIIDDEGGVLDSDRELKGITKGIEHIGDGWMRASSVSLLAMWLDAARDENNLEYHCTPYYNIGSLETLRQAAEKAFGKKFCMQQSSDPPSAVLEAMEFGYNIIKLNWRMTEIMKMVGAKTVLEVVGWQGGFKTRKATPEEYKLMAEAHAKLVKHGLGASVKDLVILVDAVEDTTRGCVIDGVVGIREHVVFGKKEVLLEVMYHELAHIRSGASDHDRAFASHMQADIVTLIEAIEELRKA